LENWNSSSPWSPLKHLGRPLVAFISALLFASSLFAEDGTGPFDELAYSLSLSFKTPMDTLAGVTEWARDINYVYAITTVVVTIVFFAVSIPLIITIRRFRMSDEAIKDLPPPKQVHGNPALEFAWTIIPVILLLFIAVPTWQAIFKQPEKAPPGAMLVKVIGHQWWWEFQYPELGITTANELHLPADTPVFFQLTSADVIHSFWVPQFGGKIDVLPGKGAENHLFVTTPSLRKPGAPQPDYYQGQCVELCGLSHALMRFQAVIHSKEGFQRWAHVHNEPPIVESELAKRGEAVFAQCQSCHTIAGTPSEDLERQMLSSQAPLAKIGPNLSSFGSRRTLAAGTRSNTEENLMKWIKNPQAIKPGALMTPMPLSDADLKAVAAYLRYSTAKTF